MRDPSHRAFLAPETLQVSSMDCGVAALACLLEGYDLRPSYEQLRALCSTEVDGTSIDALESLCGKFGVDVCQHVVPADGITDVMDGRYPLIAIVQVGASVPHFVTVWRRVGSFLQIMDPTGGRRWIRDEQLSETLYTFALPLPRDEWKQWLEGPNLFRELIERRAHALLSPARVRSLLSNLAIEPDVIGALDAALHLVHETIRTSGRRPVAWREALFERAFAAALSGDRQTVPAALWSVTVEDDIVHTRGAVMLAPMASARAAEVAPELVAMDHRPPPVPTDTRAEPLASELRALLRRDGRFLWGALLGASLTLALASTLELLIYRAAIDAPRLFATAHARAQAVFLVLMPALSILVIELACNRGAQRLARQVETELRMATLRALPRVDDRFVRSRPTSDLANRAHGLASGGQLPVSALAATRALGELFVTLVAIGCLGVAYLLPVIVAGVALALTFYGARSRVRELDTRNQIHSSRLLTIFFDVLRGLRPLRLHGYEDAFRIDQRSELGLWRTTAQAVLSARTTIDMLSGFVSTALLVTVFFVFVKSGRDPRAFVLLAFWTFRIPPLLHSLHGTAEAFPSQRVALTRLLEVTRYASPEVPRVPPMQRETGNAGAAVHLRDVNVVANGTEILHDVSVTIRPGEHVAIVGPSGSGKSTLVSLLLGFMPATSGELHVDGHPLDEQALRTLRRTTTWIDPGIQLWDASVRDNLYYATDGLPRHPFLQVAESTDLIGVLDHLDKGLDTPVGPEGVEVSGGEGQRIRVARALLRDGVRLAVLDEAFRGLDRPSRKRLTDNARLWCKAATLFFVTHDIEHALGFDRVLVMEQGRLVEDGAPGELAGRASRFRDLLHAEQRALVELWSSGQWRRLHVEDGRIREG